MATKKKRNDRGQGTFKQFTLKNGEKRWDVRIQINGVRYHLTSAKTKEEGKAWVRTLQNKKDMNTLEDPNKITLLAYMPHWCEHMKNQVKESTLKDYMSIIKTHLIPVYGSIYLKNIDTVSLNTFFDKTLADKGLAPNTKRNVRRVFHQILDQARKERIISNNPMIDVSPIKGANTNTRKALTKEQAIQLLQAGKAYYDKKRDYRNTNVSVYPLIKLAIATGARLGEMLALQWDDIDIEKQTISITKALTKEGTIQTPKTINSIRVIPIPKDVIDLCLSLNEGLSPFVFHTKEGTPISIHNMERSFKAVAKDLPFTVTPHELRHTHATLALELGVPIVDVSHMLGHAKTSTTLDFYAHSTEEGMREVSKAVANALTSSNG